MGLAQITEPLLAKSAGWEAMKAARGYLKAKAVLSAEWKSPTAKGLIQAGPLKLQAGLIFESEIDIENICTCRESRRSGILCAHSVAIALATLHPESIHCPDEGESKDAVKKILDGDEPLHPTREHTPGKSWFRRDHTSSRHLSLKWILAPNSVKQINPKSLAVMLEASSGNAFKPLNALDRESPYLIHDRDNDLLKFLEELVKGPPPPMLQIPAESFCDLLNLLQGHAEISLGRSQKTTIDSQPWIPRLNIQLEPDGELKVKSMTEDRPEGWFPGQPGYVWIKGKFRPMGLPPLLWATLQGPVRFPRSQVPLLLHHLEQWPETDQTPELSFSLDDFHIMSQAPTIHLRLEGGLARLNGRLNAVYGPQAFELGIGKAGAIFCSPDPDDPMSYVLRDPGAEQAALDQLRRAGFEHEADGTQWRLHGQDAVMGFLSGPFQSLQLVWEINLEERLEQSFERNIDSIEPEVRVSGTSGDWFEFKVRYQTSKGQILPQEEIGRLLRSGRAYQKKPNGTFLMLNPDALGTFDEAMVDCNPQQHQGRYRVPKSQSAFLEQTFQDNRWKMIQEGGKGKDPRALLKSDLKNIQASLENLRDVLRPYQWQGIAWMHQLFERGFAGILADEMGLGKTLQVLAWIQWRIHQKTLEKSPQKPAPESFLVVCPSSLVFNWAEEARRWVPSLKVLPMEGPSRSRFFREITNHDLVITSYALIRRDIEHYRKHVFGALILDEAQHIKNRSSQNAQSVKAIRSQHRLVMTGTPMENSVLDLWSIFDFLMPGYLGSARDFKERYELPITQQRAQPVMDRLRRRVSPFLLRRTKGEVRPDLPKRIDQVAYCDLTQEQRTLYQQVMETGRASLLEISGQKKPNNQARMMVLSAILRMRQICCDARLLDIPEDTLQHPSSKLSLFTELLDEALDGGHRVLVFSQFVKMLSIIRSTLEAREISYCYLDGSTAQRGKVVQRFQNSDIPVFLISLKAGGTGLNLTGADTVIHFDPWWNPAVESQATSRAHRIGQTRTVTSYKLVVRETIEERILKLQENKQAQLDAMLQSGKVETMEGLGWEEIQSLLQ
jgi:superfamily II DNA or RNA helicase